MLVNVYYFNSEAELWWQCGLGIMHSRFRRSLQNNPKLFTLLVLVVLAEHAVCCCDNEIELRHATGIGVHKKSTAIA